MKKRISFAVILIGVVIGMVVYWNKAHTPAPNPDPNHTHADFVIFLGDERLDFSGQEFMSGLSSEEVGDTHGHEHLHDYFHLHDGNGDVIHQHKPALTIGEFFSSLPDVSYQGNQFTYKGENEDVRLFVNGVENKKGSTYIFTDLDQLLLTDTTEPAALEQQFAVMSDKACLYSRTCPWRGDPPTENCIADPTVPCVVQ